MTSIRGRRCPRRKHSSATLSVALPDSFLPPELGDELPNQPAGPSETKPSVANAPAANSIPSYSEDDLQRILKAILEAWAPVSASTPVPALAPIPAPASVPAPAPISASAPVLAPASVFAPALIVAKITQEKLKARLLNIYRKKSHMDCYNFCQQYENYFTTAGATRATRIPFAVFFLRDRISFRWQKYKRRYDAKTPVPVTWDEFKTFFRQSLSNSQAFVDTYWGKLKRDSQYQQEEVLNSAAHLEHLQAILQEFDPAATLKEEIMIRCFLKGLKPFVWAKLDVRDHDLNS